MTEPKEKVVDLMAALQTSLAEAKAAAVARELERERCCVHCGVPVVGDDAGGWLHVRGAVGTYRQCRLTARPYLDEPSA